MKKRMKRGLSPVIATVLLISISIILALIIFFWARGFVGESTEKFNTLIEFACDDITFSAEVDSFDNEVRITNRGNVPLYGVEVRKRSLGSVKNVGIFEGGTITVGDSQRISFSEFDAGFSPSSNEEVVIVPLILGESDGFKRTHICEEEFGEIVTVI